MPELVTISEAARRLGVSPQYLSTARARDGTFPSAVPDVGGARLYVWPTLWAWFDARRRRLGFGKSTNDTGEDAR